MLWTWYTILNQSILEMLIKNNVFVASILRTSKFCRFHSMKLNYINHILFRVYVCFLKHLQNFSYSSLSQPNLSSFAVFLMVHSSLFLKSKRSKGCVIKFWTSKADKETSKWKKKLLRLKKICSVKMSVLLDVHFPTRRTYLSSSK